MSENNENNPYCHAGMTCHDGCHCSSADGICHCPMISDEKCATAIVELKSSYEGSLYQSSWWN